MLADDGVEDEVLGASWRDVDSSGLEVAHRGGQRLELVAPGLGRDHRAHDEFGEADCEEALDELTEGRQPHRRQLEGPGTAGGPPGGGGAGGGGVTRTPSP